MADKKKVIKGLKQCLMDKNTIAYETQCEDCPYCEEWKTVAECTGELLRDALEIIKSNGNA